MSSSESLQPERLLVTDVAKKVGLESDELFGLLDRHEIGGSEDDENNILTTVARINALCIQAYGKPLGQEPEKKILVLRTRMLSELENICISLEEEISHSGTS